MHFCEIVEHKGLADRVFSLSVVCEGLARAACAGQFVNIKCGSENLLRRPLGVCGVFGDLVRFVFEVKGEGTKWLSERKPGEVLDILGPLGNGFLMPKGNILVIGGGIGCPPMLFAAQTARGAINRVAKSAQSAQPTRTGLTAVLGFRNAESVILREEFSEYCDSVFVCTDDGSCGEEGFATELLAKLLAENKYDAVLTCGPRVMLSAVASVCAEFDTRCQVLLEERMACGVGACVVCACAIQKDGEPLRMSRVCKDGPVFDAREVVFAE